MTFEVGETINYLIDAFLRAPIVHGIAKNPIYTALIITLIVMLIIMSIFRDIDADETVAVMALRSGFWVFLMLLGVLMIHNRVLTAEHSTISRTGEYEEIFKKPVGVHHDNDFVPIREGSAVPISPPACPYVGSNVNSARPTHIPS